MIPKRQKNYQRQVAQRNSTLKSPDYIQVMYDKNTVHMNEVNKKIRDAKTKLTLEVPSAEQIRLLREQSLDNFWSYTTFKYREAQQAQYEEMMRDNTVFKGAGNFSEPSVKDYIALKHFSGSDDTLSFEEYCQV